MRSKLPDVALDDVDALRWQRIFERLPVLDLLGTDDDVERLSPPGPDQIFLDIELCQVAHTNRGHQQDLDGGGQLSSHCAAPRIAMQSAEQLQEVKHRKARIAHRGIRAIPDTIFGSHSGPWPSPSSPSCSASASQWPWSDVR